MRVAPFGIAFAVLLAAMPARLRGQETDLARRLAAQQAILRGLEADLAAARNEATRMRTDERNIVRRAVDATNRVGLLGHSLVELGRLERALAADTVALGIRRSRIRAVVGSRDRNVARRVRALYMHGRMRPYARALLGSSLADWFAARQYVAVLNRRDLLDVAHLRTDRRDLDSLAAIYAGQRTTLDSLIARKARERVELAAVARESEHLLRAVRRNRQLSERAAHELERQRNESRARMDVWLADHARRDRRDADVETAPAELGAEKGQLPWPVRGHVVGRFGRTRDRATGTWTRNRGIDIRTARSATVSAVADGQVAKVDWFRGYGTFALVSHGQNWYTLYAGLGDVAVEQGEYVRRGQTIGVAGDGGSAGDPRIHFEILAGSDALDPLDWLARN